MDILLGYDMHGLLVARLLATRYRRPLVYHCHDYVPIGAARSSGAKVAKVFEQRFARTADLVVVPDGERAPAIMRELHLQRPPLVAANSPIARPTHSGQALRESLARQGKPFACIVFRQGRIGAGHGLEATLRSMPDWTDRNWGLALMGPGETDYLTGLMQLAHDLGVDRRLALLPSVPYEQVAEFTPGAHIGHGLYDPIHFNHLYSTTASNKIMEYMAAGLPLLVSDRPGPRDLVHRYRCGVVADESSPKSVATAINSLLENPEAARQMGLAGADAFEREFRYDRQYLPVLAAMRALADGSSQVRRP